MSLVHIHNTPFRHSLGPDELQSALGEIATAGCAASGLLDQLTSALYSGIRANKKLKPDRRATLNRLPGTLNVAAHINEPVRVFPREKKGGALGVILEFGIKHRTAQDLVARVISRYLKPRQFQYGLRG